MFITDLLQGAYSSKYISKIQMIHALIFLWDWDTEGAFEVLNYFLVYVLVLNDFKCWVLLRGRLLRPHNGIICK